MMRTDDLISTLVAEARPVSPAGPRLAAALGGGGMTALLIMTAFLGAPLQAVPNTGTTAFAMKLGFTVAVAIISATACLAAGRPGDRPTRRLAYLAVPLLVVASVAAYELVRTPVVGREALLFGSTYTTCIAAVAGTSLPVLVLTTWVFRALAPTRLALAGFLIGLSSGSAAAVAYALFCPETTASFLLAAYVPAMLVPAVIGALIGPRVLRW
jgi:hypothetical protein